MATRLSYIPDKGTLTALNLAAIQNNYNRSIEPTRLKDIADAKYPITQTIMFDDYIRCRVILNSQADAVYLDMDISYYNTLPTEDVP